MGCPFTDPKDSNRSPGFVWAPLPLSSSSLFVKSSSFAEYKCCRHHKYTDCPVHTLNTSSHYRFVASIVSDEKSNDNPAKNSIHGKAFLSCCFQVFCAFVFGQFDCVLCCGESWSLFYLASVGFLGWADLFSSLWKLFSVVPSGIPSLSFGLFLSLDGM